MFVKSLSHTIFIWKYSTIICEFVKGFYHDFPVSQRCIHPTFGLRVTTHTLLIILKAYLLMQIELSTFREAIQICLRRQCCHLQLDWELPQIAKKPRCNCADCECQLLFRISSDCLFNTQQSNRKTDRFFFFKKNWLGLLRTNNMFVIASSFFILIKWGLWKLIIFFI